MTNRDEIIDFLNNYLEIDSIDDFSPKGLQVEGSQEVHLVTLGVSACLELFEKAVSLNSEMIIVHHGMFWDGEPKVIKGHLKKRLKILLENDITLLAYHLPLDKHPEIGNNALIAKNLGLNNIKPFGYYKNQNIGYSGILNKRLNSSELHKKIDELFNSKSIFFNYGPSEIKSIAIVSGGFDNNIFREFINSKIDILISGEVREPLQELCKEEKINYIAAGHYNTEKFGVQKIGELLTNKFNLKTQFIEIPNPL